MSGPQRWIGPMQTYEGNFVGGMAEHPEGPYVTYADALAWVQREVEKARAEGHESCICAHQNAAHYIDGELRSFHIDGVEFSSVREYEQGQRDVFAFHPEWTVTGMCKPDCLPCQRLTELITEREKGYDEGQRDERQRIRGGVEGLFWSPSNMLTTTEVLAVIDAAAPQDEDRRRGSDHAPDLTAEQIRADADALARDIAEDRAEHQDREVGR